MSDGTVRSILSERFINSIKTAWYGLGPEGYKADTKIGRRDIFLPDLRR